MTRPDPPQATTWRRTALVALVLAVGLAGSWVGADATWTSSVQASTTLATGRIDLTVNGSHGPVTWSALNLGGLSPSAVSYALLAVSNVGAVPLSYSMSTSTTGSSALASALTIGVRLVPSATCTSTSYGSGTTVSAEAAGLSSATITTRTLAAGSTDELCFKVTLPLGASSSLQGTSVTPSFAVTATP